MIMRTSELRALSIQALEEKLLELRKEQLNLRVQRAMGVLEKFHRFSKIRKTVARIKTILTAKVREEKGGGI